MTTKKATESQTTEATQTPAINTELIEKLGVFQSPEFTGQIKLIAICQVLNDKSMPGLFVQEKMLDAIGWEGEACNYEHTFNSGAKANGVLLKSPKMHILGTSPRFVENRKTKEIVGNYETKEGQLIYAELNADPTKKLATLRTFYMIYLVGEGNKTLHKVPLILSIKGIAAVRFGEAIKRFQTKMETIYAKAMNKGFRALDNHFHSLCVFNPTFTPSLEPLQSQGEKSWVAVVESFASPTTSENITDFLCLGKSDELWPMLKGSKNFSQAILKVASVIPKHDDSLPALPPSTPETIDVKAIAAGK